MGSKICLIRDYQLGVTIAFLFTFQRYWNREVQQAAKDLRPPRLTKALVQCYWRSYSLIGIYIFVEVRCKILQWNQTSTENKAALRITFRFSAAHPCTRFTSHFPSGSYQSHSASATWEGNWVLWELWPHRHGCSVWGLQLRCGHLPVDHRPCRPSSSLFLPCPANRHEDSCGHVSHDLSEGQSLWNICV